MFDTETSRNIWVDPGAEGEGLGTFDAPCSSVSDALKKVSPGQTMILMPGTYRGDLTIEISGTERSPIYISAYKEGEAVVEGGCWYFYDACDLVVSGMTFKNAHSGAVSVVGQCLRNRFHSIKFIDCGAGGKESCTFYIGGAGAKYNLVEDCEFSRSADMGKNIRRGGPMCPPAAGTPAAGTPAAGTPAAGTPAAGTPAAGTPAAGTPFAGTPAAGSSIDSAVVVGLMVSDGADGHPLTNHIIRNNRVCGYDKAMIVGSGSATDFESGHIVERNRIESCGACGITVKCGDVFVRGNVISKCGIGIALSGGEYSVVEGNGVFECGGGIAVTGGGHTVTGNTIAACASYAVSAIDNPPGLIADDNTITKDIPPEGIGYDSADDNDDSYISASMPSDGSDADDADDAEGSGHIVIGGDGQQIIDNKNDSVNSNMDEVLRYMFHRD